MKNWLIREDHAGNDLRQEEKGLTEGEMVGWPHQLNGHEFEQAPGGGDGQGSLVCCSPWGHRELDMTELNWNVPHSRRILEHSRIRKKWLFKSKMTLFIDCFLKIKPEFCFYVIFSRHPKDINVILDLKNKEGWGEGEASFSYYTNIKQIQKSSLWIHFQPITGSSESPNQSTGNVIYVTSYCNQP